MNSPSSNLKPFDFLELMTNYLEAFLPDLKRDGNQLSFGTELGPTVVTQDHPDLEIADGSLVETVVRVETALPADLSTADLRMVAIFNTMASMSALINDRDSESSRLASPISFLQGDPAREAQSHLFQFVALAQAKAFTAVVRSLFGQDEEAPILLNEANDPSHWGGSEFARCCELLERVHIFANASDSGFTAEFPFNGSGVSAIVGDRTWLFRMNANARHPTRGNGLFFKLEAPLVGIDFLSASNALNRAEVETIDSPPFLGAWCARPENNVLAYVGFLPNTVYMPGLAHNLTFWTLQRSQDAIIHLQEFLEDA